MSELAAPAWALERLAEARVARLATAGGGEAVEPTVVPVCFVLHDGRIYSPIDGKPKTTRRLRRVRDLERNPNATLLVDHYEEDWRRLWGIQVRGRARLIAGNAAAAALEHLRACYLQYGEVSVGPEVICLEPDRFVTWRSTDP